LGCKTWAELLTKLIEAERIIVLTKEKLDEMKKGAQDFLKLRSIVSNRWKSAPSVLEEVRRSRGYEA
jgi:hypothetical protein